MEIKELKSYGVEMNLMFQKILENHPETVKEAKHAAMTVIRKQLGIWNMPVLLFLTAPKRFPGTGFLFPME